MLGELPPWVCSRNLKPAHCVVQSSVHEEMEGIYVFVDIYLIGHTGRGVGRE